MASGLFSPRRPPFLSAVGSELMLVFPRRIRGAFARPGYTSITRSSPSCRKGEETVGMVRQRSGLQGRLQLATAMQPNTRDTWPQALGRYMLSFRLRKVRQNDMSKCMPMTRLFVSCVCMGLTGPKQFANASVKIGRLVIVCFSLYRFT